MMSSVLASLEPPPPSLPEEASVAVIDDVDEMGGDLGGIRRVRTASMENASTSLWSAMMKD